MQKNGGYNCCATMTGGNYISWGYFTDEDKVGFLDANMLDLYRLDENGIENKGWTKIYGEW